MSTLSKTSQKRIEAVIQSLKNKLCSKVVVCAGSQNAPLIEALNADASFEIFHSFDERSSAFFALGLTKKKKSTTAIITTSGTAVAECIPALLEAFHQNLPLILISADRSRDYAGTDFPQMTNHLALTKTWLNVSLDIEESLTNTSHDHTGPEHWNLRLTSLAEESILNKTYPQFSDFEDFLNHAKRPLVIIGEIQSQNYKRQIEKLIQKTPWYFYIEALAGLSPELNSHPQRITQLNFDVSSNEFYNFDSVIKLGGAPLHSFWRDLIRNSKLANLIVASLSETDAFHLPLKRLSFFSSLERFLVKNLEKDFTPSLPNPKKLPLLFSESFLSKEAAALKDLVKMIPHHATVLLGNSLAIRSWAELVEQKHTLPQNVHGIRGLNGIDGNLSFFNGLAHEEEEAWLIIGDLSLMYDQNGADFMKQISPFCKLRIVCLDNHGGRIFEKLPDFKNYQRNTQRTIVNPQSFSWKNWCKLWNIDFLEWNSDSQTYPLTEQRWAFIHCAVDYDNL